MKHYLMFTLLSLCVAGSVQAMTTWQTWENSTGWTKVVQIGNDGLLLVRPDDANYVYANPITRLTAPGYNGLYAQLGTAAIPIGTVGGAMQEFWMDFDYKPTTFSGSNSGFFGVYTSTGTNANYTTFDTIGVVLSSADIRACGYLVTSTGTLMSTVQNGIYRVKMHVHNVSGNTVLDVILYDLDLITGALTLRNSNSITVLASGASLTKGMDVWGLKNTTGGVKNNTFKFDNFYFSTDGANTNIVPTPFALDCNDSSGDFTGDCRVTFDDVAVMSEEWLGCYYIPTRLCNW